MKRESTLNANKELGIILLALFMLLFIPNTQAQPKKIDFSKPHNVRVIKEYKDRKGNTVREVEYSQGNTRMNETIIIPNAFSYNLRVPINIDTIKKDSIMLVVDKGHYCLQVYYRKRLIRNYKAVFGPKPLENKCLEGDRCTPEGWFTIANINTGSKYNKFLKLNYPNDSSIARFNKLKETGAIPQKAKMGGDVGIHGIWKGGDDMIELGVGWTDGCIALKNKDVDELYSMVVVGTKVYIKK
ncbi:MAG: L,D-transpeptidase [Bacteroidota bacterium]